MVVCPNCGQENSGLNVFCSNCGAAVSEPAKPKTEDTDIRKRNMQMHNIANQNVLGKSYVKFVLYFISIFIPPFGLILGMLISMTPFKYKEQLYSDMITYSCGVTTVLMGLAVAGIVVISVVCLILSFIN